MCAQRCITGSCRHHYHLATCGLVAFWHPLADTLQVCEFASNAEPLLELSIALIVNATPSSG